VSQIASCRICGSSQFELIIDLGLQALTGIFPQNPKHDDFPRGPLRLVRCIAEDGCGLVQLEHSFDPKIMYGENYGYRSGLNASMVNHLREHVAKIASRVSLMDGDVVCDIGSNDGTTLGFYSPLLVRIGIDPTIAKFKKYYPSGAVTISDFFSAKAVLDASGRRRAKVVTSFSMMYDLEDPQSFVNEVASILADDGIWVFEQSYLPLMLNRRAFDTICHEHLEYFGVRQIDWLLRRAGLEVIDIELNDVNGGSFAVTAAHAKAFPVADSVNKTRTEESVMWDDARSVFAEFAEVTRQTSEALCSFVRTQRDKGKTVAGLGASTKGNVLLQVAGLTNSDISVIGDVNPDKFGCVTPGSWIPIVPQEEALDGEFDFYVVLPWHFREFFLRSSSFTGCRLVFPLPKLEVVEVLPE